MERNVMKKVRKLLLSLCVLGGLSTAALVPQMYAQKEVVSTLSMSEKQSIYNKVRKAKNLKFFPLEMRKSITSDSILGEVNFPNFDNSYGPVVTNNNEDGYFIYFESQGGNLVVRRTIVREQDLTESFDKRGPDVDLLPLPAPVLARIKKDTSPEVESIRKFGAALNAVLNDAYYLQTIDEADLKKGKYTGKVLITTSILFTLLPELTQGMTPEDLEIAKITGLPISKLKNLMTKGEVTNRSNSGECSGWNEGGLQINGESVAGTLVFNGLPNLAANQGAFVTKLSAVDDNLKLLKDRLHNYAQSKGVDVEDSAKKEYTTEQMALWSYVVIVDNYFEDLMGRGKAFDKLRAALEKGKVSSKSIDLRKGLKVKYIPAKTKSTAMNNLEPMESPMALIQKGSFHVSFSQNRNTHTV